MPSVPLAALLDSLSADGRDFERLIKWYLENDPVQRALYKRVWHWDDWPGRWDRDRGIDLIAETHDGDLVAVQAKNYRSSHSVTKRDIDSFLSESNRAQIAARLLVATTDRLAPSATRTMRAQEKPVSTCLLSDLWSSPLEWPSRITDLHPPCAAKATPRPHQQEALDAIERWHDSGVPRGQVHMACGTGKSLIAVWAADRVNAERVLLLVPTLALLRQTAQSWCAEADVPRRLLRICSDHRSPGDGEGISIEDLADERTTDADDIARALASTEPLLVICTYDSSPRLAEAFARSEGRPFDLIIADEAHRCAGLEGSSHKTVLSDVRIPGRRRLFFTATPTIYGRKDRSRASKRSVRLASMDDRGLFGPVVHQLSFAEAISRGLLCPYQVAVIPIADDEVHRLITEHSLVTADGDHSVLAGELATQIACARAMRRFGCRRMVAFHPRIEDSKRFSAHFPVAAALLDDGERPENPVWSEHIDGDTMRPARRMALLRHFASTDEDEHRLLSNVRLLTEGVDVADIDSVAFVDTHRGQTAIIQAVGRAVRLSKGKTVGTIVLPIVLREGESYDAALARSEHRTAIDILAALRSADPDVLKSLDDLRFDAPPHATSPRGHGRFVVDAPVHVDGSFADAVDLAITNALGLTHERRKPQSSRLPPRVDLMDILDEPPEPTAEEAFQIGLVELERLGRHGLLARLPGPDSGFPMRVWWQEAMRRWEQRELDRRLKRIIASSLSWLSTDLDAYSAQRHEMSLITEFGVPDQIATQLGKEGKFRAELGALVGDDFHGFELVEEIAQLDRAITHAATSPAVRLLYLRLALKDVATAVALSLQAEPEEWRTAVVRETAFAGFLYEIALARAAGGSPLDIPGHSWLFGSAPKAYEIGRAAARRWCNLAQRMRIYQFEGDIGQVEAMRAGEQQAQRRARLDPLGWDIYLLARRRGASHALALEQATQGPRPVRKRVRQDLITRALRAPHARRLDTLAPTG